MAHLSCWKTHLCACIALLVASVRLYAAGVETPVSFDDRLVVELVAQEPEIVTPTGIAVDERGRIWAVENNTHFTPKIYKGSASDRIQIFEDFAPDGRAKKVTTFADGFRNSMSLLLGKNGAVFFAMRNEILLLRDTKNAGTADERKTLIKLDTAGDYPHNGLAGLALGPDGKLYFGLGENLGKPYSIIGSDGMTLKGGGEGGNIYRCDVDGGKLEIIATGFWNPWGLGFDAFGRLFAVDNDPDSRPPCRLLHVVEGGDYGYKFRYGRKGIHPFIAWNGELPDTLPMVSGTGEAPCAVYACESPTLPKDYLGDLLVTCWADNVIQRFKLAPDGASFKSRPEELIKGGANFRPVGMVMAPDGSLIVSDWANKSYPVHGAGRIWRIRAKTPAIEKVPDMVTPLSSREMRPLLSMPTVGVTAAEWLARAAKGAVLDALRTDPDIRARTAAFRACITRKFEQPNAIAIALQDKDAELRLQGIHEHLVGAVTEAQLLQMARHDPSEEIRCEALRHLKDPKSAPSIFPFLSSKDPFLFNATVNALARMNDIVLFGKYAQDNNPRIRLGVLLALRKSKDALAKDTLPKFLSDPDAEVRRAAMQWGGEEKLTEFRAALDATVKLPMSRELFEAHLAAQSLLSGDKPDKGEYLESQMTQIFPSDKHPAHFRALALRNLSVDHPGVTVPKLKELLASNEPELRTEAIRALALHPNAAAQPELRTLAGDAALDIQLRADAIAGLSRSAAAAPETAQLLLVMLKDGVPLELQREAVRALRGAAGQADVQSALRDYAGKLSAVKTEMRGEMAEQILFALKAGGAAGDQIPKELAALAGTRPTNEAEWAASIAKIGAPVDAAAGARIFYHPRGPQCFNCHRINGRGGNIGPDLSPIGKTTVRERILQSILDPSRDVAPDFVPWMFVLKDGRRLTGVIVEENNGVVLLGDTTGVVTKIKVPDIDRRILQKGSIMPDKLVDLLTQQELRDLIAFLIENGAPVAPK